MFKSISKYLVVSAIDRDIIERECAEEYIYGLNTFITIFVNIGSAVIIGLLTGMLLEIVLFMIVYKYLRKYIGGSHAKNALRCYISSCVLYIFILMLIRYYPFSSSITTVMVFISAVILYVISPVAAERKPLDELEQRVFRHRSHISITIFFVAFLLLHYISLVAYLYYVSIIIAVGVFTVTVFAVEGKLYNIKHKS